MTANTRSQQQRARGREWCRTQLLQKERTLKNRRGNSRSTGRVPNCDGGDLHAFLLGDVEEDPRARHTEECCQAKVVGPSAAESAEARRCRSQSHAVVVAIAAAVDRTAVIRHNNALAVRSCGRRGAGHGAKQITEGLGARHRVDGLCVVNIESHVHVAG